ncbi:MAG: response regulator transcription factor [Bacteroidota bacterium]
MKILLVDDNRYFLESIEKFLMSTGTGIIIVGKAFSGREAIRVSLELKPDLILMDLTMPEMGGLEATHVIKTAHNPPRIIILTMYESEEYQKAAREAGADGYVSKSDLYQMLMPCMNNFFPDVSMNHSTDPIKSAINTHLRSDDLFNKILKE